VKRVFIDSGAFFALLAQQDASHVAATAAFQRAQAERWGLITTNVIVIETYALLLSRTRAGRSAAIAFLSSNRRCRWNASAETTRSRQWRSFARMATRPTRFVMP